MKFSVWLSAALLALTPPAFAETKSPDLKIPKGATLILCEWDVPKSHTTSPEATLLMTETSGRITVTDGLVLYYAGAPVKAEVQLDNAHRTVWAWSLRRAKDNGNQYVDDIKVRLTLQKADQSALLFINPVGYMTESVRGSCGAATAK